MASCVPNGRGAFALHRLILKLILVAKSKKPTFLIDLGKRGCDSQKQNWRPVMCLKSQMIPDVPAEMVRVVRAVFPKGNLYIHLRDTLGVISRDELFEDLFPDRGQPVSTSWRLALVTVFQCMENLTDRQAADAVRSRLDGKDALSLELIDPGFHHTV
jgi:hypothetical protein